MIAFHGGADPVVKIDSNNVFFSPTSSTYNSETLCTNGKYSLPDNGATKADQKSYGSRGLYNIFKNSLNIRCELYIDCDMQHGLSESTSDFGLGDPSVITVHQVEVYIVQRAATFFQYIINPNFPYTLTHTIFVDCENHRFGCNSDASTTCSNSATCSAKNSSTKNNSFVKKEENILFTATEISKTIYLKFYKPGNSNILLFNMNGAPVKTLQTSSTQVALQGTDLASGIYILKVIQGSQTQIAKIVLR
jgi:hypothetical protein